MQNLDKPYIQKIKKTEIIKKSYNKPKTNINIKEINTSSNLMNKFRRVDKTNIEIEHENKNALIAEVLPPFIESFRPRTEVLTPLEPSIDLMSYDFFEAGIELRLMNFRKDNEDKLIYKKKNLRRIKKFLLDLKNLYLVEYNSNLEFPYIIPGPAHSIDVHWITNQYRLLINFPVNISDEITIAGHKKGRDVIKLSINPNNTVRLLIEWLNIVMKKETL